MAKCIATAKRTGNRCTRDAIVGATVCWVHGGAAPQVQAAAKRRAALGEALAELASLGIPVEIEPADAMLAMVHEAAGNVAFLRARVQELDQLLGGWQGNDTLDAIAHIGGAGKDGKEIRNSGPAAIAGRVDPHNWRAERHVLVAMYDEERDRLVRWSKACRDAGVDERRVRLAEDQGRQLAEVIRATVGALLELAVAAVEGEDQVARLRAVWAERVPSIVRSQIMTITTGEPAT